IGALEGDQGLSGDMLQIKNVAGNWVNLSTPNRPFDNFFNSKITSNGADFTNRNPASLNTLGFDSAMFPLNNLNNTIITNNQTEATVRLTSDQETYGLYLLGLSVEVWEPSLKPLKLNLNAVNATQNPGDIIPFKFFLRNTGNDDVVDLKIFTTLPPQLSLPSVITLPTGINYTYNSLTRYLEFTVANGLLYMGLPEIVVDFNLQVANECYFLTNNCNLNVPLQFIAEYKGVANPKKQTTLSSGTINSCEVGDELPTAIVVKQPVANWLTLPNALNRTVECNNSSELAAAQALRPETNKCTFTINKTSGSYVANSCGGTYTNTFTFTDACGVTSAPFTQTITVRDTTAPTGTAPADITGIQCISNVPAANPEAVTDEADNCDGPVTVTVSDTNNGGLGSTSNPYIVTRTYRLTDACGNFRDLVQKITVVDNQPPTISCPSNVSVNTDTGLSTASGVNLGTPTFADNCSTPTVSNNAPATYPIGNTTVIWTVTDAVGNTATCNQTVTVTDNENPSIACPANIAQNVDTGVNGAVVSYPTPTFGDNAPNATIAQT
ncbi:MAG: HYR domain-containing protein, partial [Caldilineaceae bacterium]